MKPCDHLSPYLDGRLERAGRDYFETHLHICSQCRDVVNAWACAKNGLKNEAADRRRRLTPTDEEAAKLVEWAILEQSSSGFGSIRVLVPLTAAVSFILAFWLGTAWTNAPEPTVQAAETRARSVLPTTTTSLEDDSTNSVALEYETSDTGHTTGKVGRDRFGLMPSSKLSVVSVATKDTVLNLETGAAVFQVSPRKNGRHFIVEAGAYRVLVVGTRFSVDRRETGVRVSVVEGIVEVSEKGGRGWRLKAGEVLSVAMGEKETRQANDGGEALAMARILGEAPFETTPDEASAAEDDALAMQFDIDDAETAKPGRTAFKRKHWKFLRRQMAAKSKAAPSIYLGGDEKGGDVAEPEAGSDNALQLNDTPKPEGVDLWRQWVLDGKLRAAEEALVAHLENNPVDTDAYSLLADCRRKAGKYHAAIEAYKKLTAIAGEYQANRARFKAGVLMQENLKNHLGAAAIFDEYLATGKGTPLLRAKATVRLAQSLIVLGETDRAKMLLRRVIDGYGGSSVAIEAREILNKMD
jgi:TolA-binding protein